MKTNHLLYCIFLFILCIFTNIRMQKSAFLLYKHIVPWYYVLIQYIDIRISQKQLWVEKKNPLLFPLGGGNYIWWHRIILQTKSVFFFEWNNTCFICNPNNFRYRFNPKLFTNTVSVKLYGMFSNVELIRNLFV